MIKGNTKYRSFTNTLAKRIFEAVNTEEHRDFMTNPIPDEALDSIEQDIAVDT